ncbi:MAG: transposase, partial [Stellaceae bacterium]
GAGWHDSQALEIPDNITLLALPSYSPELNPVERIWHYLRSHWLANSVFRSLADIMDACEMAWNRFAADPNLIRSLCAVAWAVG